MEITAEGPLGTPQAMQRAVRTTWLVPGQHVTGDGIVLELLGFTATLHVAAASPGPQSTCPLSQRLHPAALRLVLSLIIVHEVGRNQ